VPQRSRYASICNDEGGYFEYERRISDPPSAGCITGVSAHEEI
jgi:hypothetical protein